VYFRSGGFDEQFKLFQTQWRSVVSQAAETWGPFFDQRKTKESQLVNRKPRSDHNNNIYETGEKQAGEVGRVQWRKSSTMRICLRTQPEDGTKVRSDE